MADAALSSESLSKQVYLAPQKRESIRTNIQSLEWALRGRSMFNGMDMPGDIPFPGMAPPEPEILRESLEKEQALLQASTPPDLSPLEKNKLYRRLKDLDEAIKHAMPTYDMMEVPTMQHVEHHMAWERQVKPAILERRTILRILDRDNDSPFFTSVEQLRTSTPPKGDPRKTFQNFDYIEFQERTEEELQVIDDSSYGRFLELKCAGWADATITRELNWTKELYALAMSRWRKAIMEGAYTKFLELHAAGHPPTTICTLLGWTQEFYEDALSRWHASVGQDIPGQAPVSPMPGEAEASPTLQGSSVLSTPAPPARAPADTPSLQGTTPHGLNTPWFAPPAELDATAVRAAAVAAQLSNRLKSLGLRVYDVARALQIHHLTLGRKLSGTGKATLTDEDVQLLTAYCDTIERERGYTDPTDIPLLGASPATP